MIRSTIAVIAAVSLVSCGSLQPENTIQFVQPSDWDSQQFEEFQALPLVGYGVFSLSVCNSLRQRRGGATALVNTEFSESDAKIFETEFRRRGLTRRDIQLIMDIATDFGTKMTYQGLTCSAGFYLDTNKSFYSGLGHQWQVVFGGSFVYLSGDGTEQGMRVTSWN